MSSAPKVLQHRTHYVDHRRAEYPPIGEQLDAIAKGFRALADAGADLPPETLAWIKACEAVKSRYRKPTAGEADA